MRPMLATPADHLPPGGNWQHEVKWDGMRVLADVRDGRVRLTSRTEREVSVAFPELLTQAAGLARYEDLLLDGEVVSMREGKPSFGALAERFNVGDAATAATLAVQAPVTLMVFDMLRVAGTPILSRPLSQRRELLEGSGLGTARIQVPPVFPDGQDLLVATVAQGLEGVVCKRRDSTYLPGARSPDWLKIVHRTTGSYVIGGWRAETGSNRLGALLIGTPTPAGLAFRGRIGSGLAGSAGMRLLEQLRPLQRDRSPFLDRVPVADANGCTWIEPELVADLEYHGVSEGGRLRQPAWRGLRADLTPADLMDTVLTDPALIDPALEAPTDG